MPASRLYHIWYQRLRQLRPTERITRLRNMTWLVVGLYHSRSVHLSKIAEHIPGPAKLPSLTRRLMRFLDNPAVQVREWYEPLAKDIIQRVAHTEVRLIVDGSKVGFGHQLLLVAIAYRQRALPVAWTWVKSSRGHSSSWKQRALLAYVHSLIPADTAVLLVGDSEFGGIKVQQLLEMWGWQYVLRQKGRLLVKAQHQSDFQRLDSLVDAPGQSVWLSDCLLTAKYAYQVNLLAHWETGEKEPWLLATHLPNQRATLRAYRRRMWIEETFGDFKKHGFDLESTHLRHFLRLSRLTLGVVLLYVWLVAFGSRVIKAGDRHLVDRRERRDYSIFRIGRNMAQRCLVNNLPLRILFVFY